MGKEFDFSFLKKYGTVFKVFDDQDSGNICFGVADGEKRYFVKFAGAPTAEYNGSLRESVERLKSTLPIYRDIYDDALINFLFSEEIGQGFAMVFEWADGKCMGRMYEEEHRYVMGLPIREKLGIFQSIIAFLQHVTELGYVAIDFYDGSILYDANAQRTIICDIDFFRKAPSVNDMGQMWGSPRFLSPEEYCLGADIDEVTNVFTLGQMAFSLFTDSDHEREHWPLSSESYEVLQKAVSPAREERYQSIRQFAEAWQKERLSMKMEK